MRFMPDRLHSLPRCQTRYAHSHLQKWRKNKMPKRNLKNSTSPTELEEYKKRKKRYAKEKQSKARVARTNNKEIKEYQAKIKTAKRAIKLYEKAIDVLLTIQKVIKGE
jgi:rRNA maturation endonuclease Nob1